MATNECKLNNKNMKYVKEAIENPVVNIRQFKTEIEDDIKLEQNYAENLQDNLLGNFEQSYTTVHNEAILQNKEIKVEIKSENPEECVQDNYEEFEEFKIDIEYTNIKPENDVKTEHRNYQENVLQNIQDPLKTCHDNIEKTDPNYYFKSMDKNPESSVSNSNLKFQVCDITNRKDKKITHLRIHTEDKSQLSSHMSDKTKEKSYECNVCKKKFSRVYNLKTHMKIHTGEKPYECSVCKKKFKETAELKIHMRIHTGEKPYECSVCKRKFSQRGEIKTHMRIHTGEKPYECSVCEKKFSQTGAIKIHMRIHTGEKPYECNVCKRKFLEAGAMKIHMRIHTGEKPYECSVCQKKFKRTDVLKIHMRIHTRKK